MWGRVCRPNHTYNDTRFIEFGHSGGRSGDRCLREAVRRSALSGHGRRSGREPAAGRAGQVEGELLAPASDRRDRRRDRAAGRGASIGVQCCRAEVPGPAVGSAVVAAPGTRRDRGSGAVVICGDRAGPAAVPAEPATRIVLPRRRIPKPGWCSPRGRRGSAVSGPAGDTDRARPCTGRLATAAWVRPGRSTGWAGWVRAYPRGRTGAAGGEVDGPRGGSAGSGTAAGRIATSRPPGSSSRCLARSWGWPGTAKGGFIATWSHRSAVRRVRFEGVHDEGGRPVADFDRSGAGPVPRQPEVGVVGNASTNRPAPAEGSSTRRACPAGRAVRRARRAGRLPDRRA